jgi:PAS domain S-box-containing protein
MATGPDHLATTAHPSKAVLSFFGLMEFMPLPAYICDSEGLITYFNQKAKLLWGREPKLNDPVDRFCGSFKLFSPSGAPITHDQCWMAVTLRTGKEFNGHEIVIERPDGQRVTVLAHINPIRDESGQLLGATNVLVDITDCKQVENESNLEFRQLLSQSTAAEVERKQAESRYQELVDSVEAIVWRGDAQTLRFAFVSRQAERILGYPVERWLAEPSFWKDHIPPEDREWVCAYCLKAIQEKRNHRLEYRMVAADGRTVWVQDVVNVVLQNDEPKKLTGLMVDVTDRKQAEEILARDALVMRSIRDSVILTDLEGKVTYWNDGATHLFGWTAEEMLGRHYADRFPEPMRSWVIDQIRLRAGGQDWAGEHEDLRKDGTLVWIDARVRRIADSTGRCVGILGLAHDISDRKRAEGSRAHLAAIVESSVDAIVAKTLDGTITSWNAGAGRLFGYPAAEIVGRSINVIVPADRHDEEEDILRRIRLGEQIEHFNTIRVHKDGSLVNVSVTVSPIRDATGSVVGASKIARDITNNIEAEEKLRRSEHRLAEAQRVAHIGSWELDLNTKELTWSDEHFRLFGLDRREGGIRYEEAMACLLPEDAAQVHQIIDQTMRARRPFKCDYRVRLPDGAIRFLQGRGEFILGVDGQPVKMVGTVQDITERKQIEAERENNYQQVLSNREQLRVLSRGLIQAQETERRRLAGELHDEIGQVLTAVSLSLELTKGTVDEGARGRLEESMAIVDRAIDQIRGMSLNLRPAMLDVMGLESALRWFVGQQMNANGTKIEFVSTLAGKRVSPELETACFRIVQETLTNVARHAQAHLVRVELTLSSTELILSIQDDGAGFDVATARLRATTGGSFGLLGMEERARLLGGSCEIDSAIGCGTTVRVRLPLN